MKPENPTIAIETFKLATKLLNIPSEVKITGAQSSGSGEVIEALFIQTTVTAGRGVTFAVRHIGDQYHVFDTTLDAKAGWKIAECGDIASALVGVLFAVVSDVLQSSNVKAVEDYVATGVSQHKIFCPDCRQLVNEDQFDREQNKCKQCVV